MSFTARPSGTDLQISAQQDKDGAYAQSFTHTLSPVYTATVTSGGVVSFGGTTTIDATGYASFTLEAHQTDAGAFPSLTFDVEYSIDGSQWDGQTELTEDGDPIGTTHPVGAGVVVGPVLGRYIRVNSSARDGSSAGSIKLQLSTVSVPSATTSIYADGQIVSLTNPLPIMEHRSNGMNGPVALTIGATAVQLLALNAERHHAIIANEGTTDLLISFGDTDATTTLFGLRLPPKSYYTTDAPGVWTGRISAIRESGSGTVMVTEFQSEMPM